MKLKSKYNKCELEFKSHFKLITIALISDYSTSLEKNIVRFSQTWYSNENDEFFSIKTLLQKLWPAVQIIHTFDSFTVE